MIKKIDREGAEKVNIRELAKHDDFIRRVSFSRKGDKIQFEMIVVGQDEDSVTIGIKNE